MNYQELDDTIISNHKVFNFSGRNLIINRVNYEETSGFILRRKSFSKTILLGIIKPSKINT